MSSDGYLYVTEVVRDVLEVELDEKFGKGKWHLQVDTTPYNDIWSEADLPDEMEFEVCDDDDKVLAKLIVENVFSVEKDMHTGRYVSAMPKIKKILRRVK